MKKEDIDRLKEICDKEGFELNLHWDGPLFEINHKKDPWDGVEFVKCISNKSGEDQFTLCRVYKVVNPNKIESDSNFIDDNGRKNGWSGINKKRFSPSTEDEYVDQLKKECFERFGEIKEGDRFKFQSGSTIAILQGNKEWDYIKDKDLFFYYNVPIYQSGQWATKLPERVKVEFDDWCYEDGNYYSESVNFRFNIKNWDDRNYLQIGEYLAKQLEKYLNNEQ